MRAAVHRSMGNAEAKCPACIGANAAVIRELQGCDLEHTFGEPVPEDQRRFAPSLTITCTLCAGHEGSCPVCSGTGEEVIFKCVGALMDGPTNEFFGYYSDYRNGILPDEGGMSDQAAAFVDLVRVADSERGAIQAEEQRLRDKGGRK